MTNEQAAIHRELITSPRVYIDFGSTIGLVPCKVQDTRAFMNKTWNAKNYANTITVIPSFTNKYQNG
jgi:valyl-tRNA synthetase